MLEEGCLCSYIVPVSCTQAIVVTDAFAMYIGRRAGYYRAKKYQQVDQKSANECASEQQKPDPNINYGTYTAEIPDNEKQPLLLATQPTAGSPP